METGRKRIGKWTAEGMRKGVSPEYGVTQSQRYRAADVSAFE